MLSDLSGGVNLACERQSGNGKQQQHQNKNKRRGLGYAMLGKKEGRKGPKEVDCSLTQGKLDRSILFRIG